MPLISIIVPTLRVGGIDILFKGLEQQNFRDFELILVDHLYKYRKDQVDEYAKHFSFPVKHVEPIGNRFPINTYQRCMNTGLVHADGKIVYLTCDYAWLPPNCLAEHADFQCGTGFRHSMIGVFQHFLPPKLCLDFPIKYGPGEWDTTGDISQFIRKINDQSSAEATHVSSVWTDDIQRLHWMNIWADRYTKDILDGKLNQFMISTYEKPFSSTDCGEIIHTEPKASMPEGFVAAPYAHFKNDSIPLQNLLQINGFDEDFDECHSYQDSELSERLHVRTSLKHYLKPTCMMQIVESHSSLLIRKVLRPENTNGDLYHAKRNAGYSCPVNSWNVSEKRLERIR